MKKSVALVGVSVLGLAGAVSGATGVQAAPVLPALCTNAGQHTLSATATAGADWYMDCVPQYGLGKAEFTIHSSAAQLPTGFVALNDPSVTVTSTTPPAPPAYFGSAPSGDFIGVVKQSEDASSQTYSAHYVAPVLGVAPILPSALPTGCNPDVNVYNSAYAVSYGATSTTFTQTTPAGITSTVAISIPARTLYLGFSIVGNLFNTGAAACASDLITTNFAANSTDANFAIATRDHATVGQSAGTVNPEDTFDPLGLTLDPVVNGGVFPSTPTQLGTFALVSTATPVTPASPVVAVTPQPTLAATGQNPAVNAALGALFLALGVGLSLIARRRRSSVR